MPLACPVCRIILRVMRAHRAYRLAVSTAALVLAWYGCRPPQPAHPNLLWIVSDTLRADALSCYGGLADTPNLCALAARGALFERAYSNAAWTLPSSVSMRYASESRNGCTWSAGAPVMR